MAIAICDNGVEWTHVDLAENIWENPGEVGEDASGQDKRTNGVDDDRNGYVDDWHGWDFVGNPLTISALDDELWNSDNDPAPRLVNVANYRGNHGTQVAGSSSARTNNGIGIAGTGFRTKLLPIKCAADSLRTISIRSGYDGIRYAADLGAKVINCSFGNTRGDLSARSIQETVNYGTQQRIACDIYKWKRWTVERPHPL